MTVGHLTTKYNDAEIVIGSRRDAALYLKVFTFDTKHNRLRLRQRTIVRPIKTLDYQLTIHKRAVIVKNNKGQNMFYWKPFRQ